MILYIMRHAEAVEESDLLQDAWRYLTKRGRSAAEMTSTAIAKTGPKPRWIITSPLTRATQTAEIAAKKACRKNVVVASPLLLPGADSGELAVYLKGHSGRKRVLLVGHEPQLGLLIAALLGRKEKAFPLKKGACVALEFEPGRHDKPAGFLWYLVPGKKKMTSLAKAFPSAELPSDFVHE